MSRLTMVIRAPLTRSARHGSPLIRHRRIPMESHARLCTWTALKCLVGWRRLQVQGEDNFAERSSQRIAYDSERELNLSASLISLFLPSEACMTGTLITTAMLMCGQPGLEVPVLVIAFQVEVISLHSGLSSDFMLASSRLVSCGQLWLMRDQWRSDDAAYNSS